MVKRAFLLVAIAAILFYGIVRADDPILTGSTIKMQDAAVKGHGVFVGKFTDLGPTAPTSPNMAAFLSARVKVLKVLRGSVKPKDEVMLEFDIFGINREALPQLGTAYIFFVIPEGERPVAIKILPATDATIDSVEKIISN